MFLLGTAPAVALGLTKDEAKAEAETARHPRRRQQRAGQSATAKTPAQEAPAAFKPTSSISQFQMAPPSDPGEGQRFYNMK
jgi:hypothetical protein